MAQFSIPELGGCKALQELEKLDELLKLMIGLVQKQLYYYFLDMEL